MQRTSGQRYLIQYELSSLFVFYRQDKLVQDTADNEGLTDENSMTPL